MSEFVDNLETVFSEFGSVSAKRMFGGYGIYHDGLMFGLVADDELYLKADSQSTSHFTDKGLSPFEYNKNGKSVKMTYYQAPEEIYDDSEVAREWAIIAFDAVLRGRSQRKK